MSTQLAFASAVLGCVLAACGGDDGGSSIDAPPAVDASTVDAPNAPAQGVGAVCSQTMACPTTPAGLGCVAFSETATQGMCTISCGTTAKPAQGTQPTPPAGGNAICQATMPAPGAGTLGCVIPTLKQGDDTMLDWRCGIGCGTVQGTDLGSCPGGLTCTDNLCQP